MRDKTVESLMKIAPDDFVENYFEGGLFATFGDQPNDEPQQPFGDIIVADLAGGGLRWYLSCRNRKTGHCDFHLPLVKRYGNSIDDQDFSVLCGPQSAFVPPLAGVGQNMPCLQVLPANRSP